MTEVIQGEDKILTLNLLVEGEPFDLTGLTAATATFAGTTGVVQKTLAASQIAVTSPATLGQLTVTLAKADTLAMLNGDQPFQLLLDFGSLRKIALVRGKLMVRKQLFT